MKIFSHLRRICAHRAAPSSLLAAALTALAAAPVAAQFVPTEVRVSPHRGLVDYEISQQRAKIAWTDPKGDMWLADVNRDTGAFEPAHGRGQLLAQNTVANWNMFMWNGPEWVATASGDQIFYSFYVDGMPKIANNTRMGMAVMSSTGEWVARALSPDVPRMAHVASTNPRDKNPMIRYLDPNLNQYWRYLKSPKSEEMLTMVPASNKSWRFANGVRAFLYTEAVEGVPQVFAYMLDDRVSVQLTTDNGAKDLYRTVPWVWPAPEFDGDLVLSTVVDGSELRIYRRMIGADGVARWTPVYSATLPEGRLAGSPEWFVYKGKSYVFMVAYTSSGLEYPTEIWLSNIDAADPLLRKITVDEPYRARNDPEVFITTQGGPYIYYNRYDPSIDPDHPLCADCSEGVFRADAGLLGR